MSQKKLEITLLIINMNKTTQVDIPHIHIPCSSLKSFQFMTTQSTSKLISFTWNKQMPFFTS